MFLDPAQQLPFRREIGGSNCKQDVPHDTFINTPGLYDVQSNAPNPLPGSLVAAPGMPHVSRPGPTRLPKAPSRPSSTGSKRSRPSYTQLCASLQPPLPWSSAVSSTSHASYAGSVVPTPAASPTRLGNAQTPLHRPRTPSPPPRLRPKSWSPTAPMTRVMTPVPCSASPRPLSPQHRPPFIAGGVISPSNSPIHLRPSAWASHSRKSRQPTRSPCRPAWNSHSPSGRVSCTYAQLHHSPHNQASQSPRPRGRIRSAPNPRYRAYEAGGPSYSPPVYANHLGHVSRPSSSKLYALSSSKQHPSALQQPLYISSVHDTLNRASSDAEQSSGCSMRNLSVHTEVMARSVTRHGTTIGLEEDLSGCCGSPRGDGSPIKRLQADPIAEAVVRKAKSGHHKVSPKRRASERPKCDFLHSCNMCMQIKGHLWDC
jgi:hypothetical protein